MKNEKDSQENRKNVTSLYFKLSNEEKELFRKTVNFLFPEKKILTFNDLIKFEKIKELLLPLKEKYQISLDNLFDLIKQQLFLPVSIFNKKLTVLESVVKFLKEEKNLSLNKIALFINRDQRNIWHTYNQARKKYPKKFIIDKVKFWIPISIFSDTKSSALESIVWCLKEEFSLNYHEIALLLKRDDRTIWTVYQRARKKNVKSK